MDELEEIDGVRPNKLLKDGEELPVVSFSSGKSVYTVKRTWDHYHCTCPAWRNQKTPVDARTCKHLTSVLGKEYEVARLELKNPGAKPVSKAKPPGNKRKQAEDEEAKPPVTRVKRRKQDDANMDVDEAENPKSSSSTNPTPRDDNDDAPEDELAFINGVRPKVMLKDGEDTEVKSLTSNATYKRTWDHFYCTCPAWRNQSGAPVNARSCKHLKAMLGDKYEAERLKLKNPEGQTAAIKKKKAPAKKGAAATKGKGKVKADDNHEPDEDVEDDKPVSKKAPDMLLANKWDLEKGLDPTGWWCSEKLDGVRVFYDGKQNKMISRLGNPFTPPSWFLDKLPKDITLDGELFGKRGNFQDTVSIFKTIKSPHWKNITFEIFDVPSRGDEPFEDRVKFLNELFGPGGSNEEEQINVVAHQEIRDRDHVFEELKKVEAMGGEGLMLRKPKSLYEGKRSSTLLKVKTFYDAEAIVIGYTDGAGKNKGVTGALKCKMASGKTFNVGTGLSDKLRKKPPKIGTIICYRFQELTRDKVPRFPSYIGEAADKTEPKDAEIRKVDGGDDD